MFPGGARAAARGLWIPARAPVPRRTKPRDVIPRALYYYRYYGDIDRQSLARFQGTVRQRVTRTCCWVLAARCRVPWVPARSLKTDAFPAPCARRAQGLPRADERDAFSRSCLRFSFITRENKNDDYFSQFCSRIESE